MAGLGIRQAFLHRELVFFHDRSLSEKLQLLFLFLKI